MVRKISLLLFLFGATAVENADILFLVPMSTFSEKHFYQPIIEALADQGHNLTVVTSRKEPKAHKNVHEFMPITVEEIVGNFSSVESEFDALWELIFHDLSLHEQCFDQIYRDKEFLALLDRKFDLVIINAYFGPGFYGFIYKLGAPFIFVSSFPMPNDVLKGFGASASPSHVPYSLIDYSDRMTFWQRWKNFWVDIAVYLFREFKNVPFQERVYKKHLGNDLPGAKEIERNASLMLINSHFTSTYHRPMMPDVVEIGGIHCREPEPLPQDLEALLNKSVAPNGFLYISFGTVVNGSSLNSEIRNKFLRVFSKLKLKVIWKWETETMEVPVPENVVLRKWLPQQDILGHPNIRLFISHAGLLSTQQSIYHGVPTIYFPFYFDQMTNAKGVHEKNAGIKMDIWTFTEEELESAINAILTEPRYRNNIKLLSEVFKDQPQTPLERAVFWINHVLKFGGGKHLASSARELNFMQLQSIDVLLVSMIMILMPCLLIGKIVSLIATAALSKSARKEKKA